MLKQTLFLTLAILITTTGSGRAATQVTASVPNFIQAYEFDEAGRAVRKELSDGAAMVYQWGLDSRENELLFEGWMRQAGLDRLFAGETNTKALVKVAKLSPEGRLETITFYREDAAGTISRGRPFARYDAGRGLYCRYFYAADGSLRRMIKVQRGQARYSVQDRVEGNVFKVRHYESVYNGRSGIETARPVREELFRKVQKDGKLYALPLAG